MRRSSRTARAAGQAGFSLIEMLVGLTILMLAMVGLASLLIQNSKINKAEQLTAEVQANARNTLSMVVQKMRSAGWDPMNWGIPTVRLDGAIPGSDATDSISEIEVYADLDEDPSTTGASDACDGTDEQIHIRHLNNQVIWRRTNDPSDPYVVVANNISNDANGDGTIEPMFTVDDPADPTVVTIQITAQSPVVDPVTKDFIRYTVSSDVVLRKDL
jgi:prepilin-type N-terminal cleavage/methylation domain-containing protein